MPTQPQAVEHVVLWNMTTYEWTYIALILVQTVFLIKYAWETVKLRKTADAQLEIVRGQNETMRLQNETLSRQLAASIEEITHNRKYEIAKISPMFVFSTVARNAGQRAIRIEDVKNRIKWNEIRSTVAWAISSLGIPSGNARTISVPEHIHTVYIGIRYNRLVDNEEAAVVFSFDTTTGKDKEEIGMDFYKLPVPQ